MLLASAVFGVLKFNDVFSSGSPASDNSAEQTELEQPQTDPEEEKPAEEEKPEEKTPTKTPDKPAPQPSASCNVASPATVSWVINKQRPLSPKSYVPSSLRLPNVRVRTTSGSKLRCDAASAAEKLFADAKAAGFSPMVSSGYRSYQTQSSLYNNYVAQDGQAAADTYSARPGHSEHQTGLSFDICNSGSCSLVQSFGNTGLGKWVAANAHKYGFVVRYPQGKTSITGYTYEPWHLRYVGTTVAGQIKSSGQTLEEHFGLPAAPDYN